MQSGFSSLRSPSLPVSEVKGDAWKHFLFFFFNLLMPSHKSLASLLGQVLTQYSFPDPRSWLCCRQPSEITFNYKNTQNICVLGHSKWDRFCICSGKTALPLGSWELWLRAFLGSEAAWPTGSWEGKHGTAEQRPGGGVVHLWWASGKSVVSLWKLWFCAAHRKVPS